MILKASSDSGSLSDDLRSTSLPLGSMPFTGGTSSGRRQIIDHRVEERLHALVLERRAAKNREERAGDSGLADKALERRYVGFLAFEIRRHGVVIEFDRGLDELLAIFLGLVAADSAGISTS